MNCSAPFDLCKNHEKNLNIDYNFRAKSFYNQGAEFFSAAKILFENGHFDMMSVILSNAAFACELLLKSLLYIFSTDIKSIKGHNLQKLFNSLPEKERLFIEKNIFNKSPKKDNFKLCLSEQKEAFPQYRYSCEVSRISGDYNFLLSFANILEYICSMNLSENY